MQLLRSGSSKYQRTLLIEAINIHGLVKLQHKLEFMCREEEITLEKAINKLHIMSYVYLNNVNKHVNKRWSLIRLEECLQGRFLRRFFASIV